MPMRYLYFALLGCFALAGTGAVLAQPAPVATESVKLGMILDMGSLYADVTGPGSELAARMAVADFGGKVLGRPIEV
jgi:branched-chain amino acid transport system substrate-binding protein